MYFFSILFFFCKECKAKTSERKAHTISFHKILILRCTVERKIDKVYFFEKLHIRTIPSLDYAFNN